MKVARRSRAICLVAEPHTTGNTWPDATPMGQRLLQLLDARDLALEVALHEIVVRHDDPLDQGVVHRMLPAGHFVGYRPRRGLAAVVGDSGVREQVGHAPEPGLLADR